MMQLEQCSVSAGSEIDQTGTQRFDSGNVLKVLNYTNTLYTLCFNRFMKIDRHESISRICENHEGNDDLKKRLIKLKEEKFYHN